MSVPARIPDLSPTGLAQLYTDLGRELGPYDDRFAALAATTRVAVRAVPGAEWASITEGRGGTFATVAATDDAACVVDQVQYDLGTGPCVDAVLEDTVFRTDDVRRDGRWPEFGRRAAEVSAARSMLAFRLFLEDDARIAGLNLYSTRTAAFDDASQVVGTLMATHGALAVRLAAARADTAHLQRALASNRDIGTAMGVLMVNHKVTRDQAFDLLRVASQHANRKLVDVAQEVVDRGELGLPGTPPRPGRRRPIPVPRR